MNLFVTLRCIFGLLLGMVLQISLAVPAGRCVSTERCKMQANTCPCCNGTVTCRCARSTAGKDKTPEPVAPPTSPYKVDAMVPIEIGGFLLPASDLLDEAPEVASAERCSAPVTGYYGVRIPVAYCSLVI